MTRREGSPSDVERQAAWTCLTLHPGTPPDTGARPHSDRKMMSSFFLTHRADHMNPPQREGQQEAASGPAGLRINDNPAVRAAASLHARCIKAISWKRRESTVSSP